MISKNNSTITGFTGTLITPSIIDDAKRQQVVDTIVSAPTRAEVEARKHKLGVIPDLLLGPEKRLVDIKTVCAKKYYRPGLIRGAAGSGGRRKKRKRADSPRQTPLQDRDLWVASGRAGADGA